MSLPAEHQHDTFEIVYLVLRSFVPLISGTALLFGGIWLLTLPIPGWKLILGLPAAQLGIVVLMFTFDDMTKKRLHPEHYDVLICPYCSHENLLHEGESKIHCGKCQKPLRKP